MVLLLPLSQLLVILQYFLLEKGLSFWPGGKKKTKQPCAHCYAQTGDNVPVLGDLKTVCIIIMSVVNLEFFKANVWGEKKCMIAV